MLILSTKKLWHTKTKIAHLEITLTFLCSPSFWTTHVVPQYNPIVPGKRKTPLFSSYNKTRTWDPRGTQVAQDDEHMLKQRSWDPRRISCTRCSYTWYLELKFSSDHYDLQQKSFFKISQYYFLTLAFKYRTFFAPGLYSFGQPYSL